MKYAEGVRTAERYQYRPIFEAILYIVKMEGRGYNYSRNEKEMSAEPNLVFGLRAIVKTL